MINEGMLIGERYEILGLIGSGGMADVYKARDSKLNRLVAVKVLRQEFRMDKTFVGKFQKEAQAAAGLSHPNIVSVYDVGEDENANFIVMELVEGITLKKYIEVKNPYLYANDSKVQILKERKDIIWLTSLSDIQSFNIS